MAKQKRPPIFGGLFLPKTMGIFYLNKPKAIWPSAAEGWPKARPKAERSAACRAEQTCEPRSIAAAELGKA